MLHLELKQAIECAFGRELAQPIELFRDALLVQLKNEAVIELRIAGATEYSMAWRWGDAKLRIDTAPLHPELATFPQHLHDSDGRLRPDPLTRCGDAAWDNVRRVIAAVARDPLLLAPAAPAYLSLDTM